MNIRAAVETDLPEWVEMRSALWPESSDDHPREITEFFAGESIDIVAAFVIESNVGALAGFIEINIRSFAEGSRMPKVPYVEAWYVRPDWQGKGYGRALMQRAESWAIEKGFTELASDTTLNNNLSIALHKHLGFKETERVVCFLKRLK